nr:MAG TPA: hypothetical protein [Caudoviricetes sp.]
MLYRLELLSAFFLTRQIRHTKEYTQVLHIRLPVDKSMCRQTDFCL